MSLCRSTLGGGASNYDARAHALLLRRDGWDDWILELGWRQRGTRICRTYVREHVRRHGELKAPGGAPRHGCRPGMHSCPNAFMPTAASRPETEAGMDVIEEGHVVLRGRAASAGCDVETEP